MRCSTWPADRLLSGATIRACTAAMALAWITGCAGSTARAPVGDVDDVSEAALRASLVDDMALHGPSATSLQQIAASYWRAAELDSARIYLERAVEVDPRHPASLSWLSRLYYESGDLELGIKLLEPVVRDEPEVEPELLANLAVLKMARGDLEEAEAILIDCTKRYRSYAPAYGNLGFLYMQIADTERARVKLEEAIERDDGVPEFHNNLGIVYRRQHEFEQAAHAFERAIAIDPEFLEAHHNLALLYKLYLFDDVRARQHFRSFIALGGTPEDEIVALFRLEEDDESHH